MKTADHHGQTLKFIGADYYNFLGPDGKRKLADEFLAGPQMAFELVSPKATDQERMAIGVKRFADKFLHYGPDPLGHYPEGYVFQPCIRDRLINDGFLPK